MAFVMNKSCVFPSIAVKSFNAIKLSFFEWHDGVANGTKGHLLRKFLFFQSLSYARFPALKVAQFLR